MKNVRLEFWLKQDGAIEQIVDHEKFSAKIASRPKETFNVAMLSDKRAIFYNVYNDGKIFKYNAMHAPISQIEKVISVARLLRAVA